MSGTAPDTTLAGRLREIVRAAATESRTLPSEPTLASTLGVSRPALREELARLESAGLIRRRQGASTIANPGAFDLAARFDEQIEFADVLRAAGYVPTMEVIEGATTSISDTDAGVLHVETSSPALRTVKRWRADGRAVMLAIDVIPITARNGEVDPIEAGRDLFDLVHALSGEHVEWELTWPGAGAVPAQVGRWLELPPRSPVMTLDLVGVCPSGRRGYRAMEYHVPGVVRAGFVRTVRTAGP